MDKPRQQEKVSPGADVVCVCVSACERNLCAFEGTRLKVG